MVAREAEEGQVPDPVWRKMTASEMGPFYANAATGEFSTAPPRPVSACRGGFFCDEPARDNQGFRV